MYGTRKASASARRGTEARAECSLEDPPAVVAADRDNVDLFLRALSDVSDKELTRRAIKGKPPRVPKAQREDLIRARRAPKEGIGRWRRVRQRARRVVHANSEDLPEQVINVLGMVILVVGAPSIPPPDVQEPVRAELDHATVVIRLGLEDDENRRFDRVGHVGVGNRRAIFGDDGPAVSLAGVADEEAPIGRIRRMKGKPEQSALPPRQHPRGDIEEDRRGCRLRLKHQDPARLFHDKQPVGAITSAGHVEGTRETGG